MAMKGVQYPIVAKYAIVDGQVEYTEGKVLSRAIKFEAKKTVSEDKIQSDNVDSEIDSEITAIVISENVDDLSLENEAYLFGHTYEEATGLKIGKDDVAPYVGHGVIGTRVKAGKKSYLAVWYNKVKFAPYDETYDQKQNGFNTPTMTGNCVCCDVNGWGEKKEFDKLADAVKYLKGKANIPVT